MSITPESVLSAVGDYLVNDPEFNGLMKGGIHYGDTIDEISLEKTPSAFDDNKELETCCLVKSETAVPVFGQRDSFSLPVVLWIYDIVGYADIGRALSRAFTLLHDTRIPGKGIYNITRADQINRAGEDVLNAYLGYARYIVVYRES